MYTTNPKISNQLSIWLISMFWIVSFMIIVGGLTRLTDSGLSITEWELFSGFFPPLNQNDWIVYFNLYKQIPEFKLQNYNMTLNEFKVIFWWEWAHRFLGRLIGLGYLIPLNNSHSVIERPESVSLVKPPTIILMEIIQNIVISQIDN